MIHGLPVKCLPRAESGMRGEREPFSLEPMAHKVNVLTSVRYAWRDVSDAGVYSCTQLYGIRYQACCFSVVEL